MSNILITNSNEFENIIKEIEISSEKINEIFIKENNNMDKINATSTWTGKTQEAVYKKYSELKDNYKYIEEAMQIYVKFMKKTLDDYKKLEEKINNNIEVNINNMDVNS